MGEIDFVQQASACPRFPTNSLLHLMSEAEERYSKLSSWLMTPVMALCQRLSKLESLLDMLSRGFRLPSTDYRLPATVYSFLINSCALLYAAWASFFFPVSLYTSPSAV